MGLRWLDELPDRLEYAEPPAHEAGSTGIDEREHLVVGQHLGWERAARAGIRTEQACVGREGVGVLGHCGFLRSREGTSATYEVILQGSGAGVFYARVKNVRNIDARFPSPFLALDFRHHVYLPVLRYFPAPA